MDIQSINLVFTDSYNQINTFFIIIHHNGILEKLMNMDDLILFLTKTKCIINVLTINITEITNTTYKIKLKTFFDFMKTNFKMIIYLNIINIQAIVLLLNAEIPDIFSYCNITFNNPRDVTDISKLIEKCPNLLRVVLSNMGRCFNDSEINIISKKCDIEYQINIGVYNGYQLTIAGIENEVTTILIQICKLIDFGCYFYINILKLKQNKYAKIINAINEFTFANEKKMNYIEKNYELLSMFQLPFSKLIGEFI